MDASLYKRIVMLESKLIEQITKVLGPESAQYIGDDCASINFSSKDSSLLFSSDTLNEDTHFSSELFSPYHLGWKAAAVNISDICAMAAEPLYMLVSLSLPKTEEELIAKLNTLILHDENFAKIQEGLKNQGLTSYEIWVNAFYQGLKDCAKQYGSAIVIGGDLTRSHSISVTINIIGKQPRGKKFLRSLAKPGYKVCVTGKFGNAKSFLDEYQIKEKAIAQIKEESFNDYKYFFSPCPRYKEALLLRDCCDSAALMDSSDGLVQALSEISKQSKVKISIDLDKIPRDKYLTIEQALYGGEDFELVACLPELIEGFTQIGIVEEGEGLIDKQGLALGNTQSFEHFCLNKNP